MRRLLLTLFALSSLGACGGLGGEPEIIATVAPLAPAQFAFAGEWQPDINNGARIYAERCTDCHGQLGDGQGELVLAGSVEPPLDMTDREAVAVKSPLDWYEIITEGRIENLMPPWENALSEAERWDVALYSYSLSYSAEILAKGAALWQEGCDGCQLPATIPPVFSDEAYGKAINREFFAGALTRDEALAVVAHLRLASLPASGGQAPYGGDAAAAAALIRISGRVTQGTAGAVVPADTVVQLRYGNAELGYSLAESSLAADLSFSFAEIPLMADFTYVVSAIYQGRLYSRRLPTGESEATITLYDLTDDPAVVSIARIDYWVEAVKLADWGAGLVVSQVIGFHNASDRVFASGRQFDDGREAVLLIQFPAGARRLSGDENGRFVLITEIENLPDSVIDTIPVPPGDSHQVVMEYFLPYGDPVKLEQEFNNAIDAEVSVTLADDLRLDSDFLRVESAEAKRDELRRYSGRLQIQREPRLSFSIIGDPFATSSDDESVVTEEDLPALALGAGAIALALLAGAGYLKRRRQTDASDIDRLVAELARLDDDHEQGRINHDLYHHRRREIKAKLAALIADEEA